MKNTNRQSGMAPVVIILIVLGLLAVGGGALYFKNNKAVITAETPTPSPEASPEPTATPDGTTGESTVKEFTMTSWFGMKDGKPATFFSLNEMKVKKGDTVRIKITNTKGNHDFNIDEYGIKKTTPLNEEVVVEFVADKAGSFKYYCSMPNHRMMGQEGTLIVEDVTLE